MKKIVALIALAGVAAVATAQPGTRDAIVYGARAVGDTTWNFGSFSAASSDSNPLTLEIGVFFFRASGVGFSTAVYKTYMDGMGAGDSAAIIDDLSNGTSPGDGRQSVYNSGAQTQAVFTNRSTSAPPGPGFRISSSADAADASAAGGVSVKQASPLNNPNFHQGDGELGYRFNITLACTVISPDFRTVTILTPVNKINSYTSYNALDSGGTTEHKATTVSDALTIRATWNIPAPSALALLGLGGLVTGRRRR